MRSKLFKILISIAEGVGTVKSANMYSDDFLNVEGTTADGKEFYVRLNVQDKKEEKTDGN